MHSGIENMKDSHMLRHVRVLTAFVREGINELLIGGDQSSYSHSYSITLPVTALILTLYS